MSDNSVCLDIPLPDSDGTVKLKSFRGLVYEEYNIAQRIPNSIQKLCPELKDCISAESIEFLNELGKIAALSTYFYLNSEVLDRPTVEALEKNGVKGIALLFVLEDIKKHHSSNGAITFKYLGKTTTSACIKLDISFDIQAILCIGPIDGIEQKELIYQIVKQVGLHIEYWRNSGGVIVYKSIDGVELENFDFSHHFMNQELELDASESEAGTEESVGKEDMTSEVICPHCSFSSPDKEICQRCRRPYVNDSVNDTSNDSFSNASSDQGDLTPSPRRNSFSESPSSHKKKRHSSQSSDCSSNESSPAKSESGREHHKRRCSRKRRKPEPPIVEEDQTVVLSSDDETSKPSYQSKYEYPPPVTNVFAKEPTLEELIAAPRDSLRGGGVEMERLLDSPDVERVVLGCRTVRFGSYKMVPQDRIHITEHGLKITLPGNHKKNPLIVKIMMKDIVKVLIHFGKSGNSASAPAIFYYVNIHAGSRIRDFLNKMTDTKEEIFFDPTSKDELHKRITLLPENITQIDRLFLKSIYETRCLLEEITWDEANDILVRAAPKEVQHTLKKEAPKHVPSSSNNSNDIQVIMIYPPPPHKGGISINTEDYACLKEDQFLNDVIIDFYLKYLYLNILNEEQKRRTHIFSSFFYKRLTSVTPNPRQGQEKLTPAEKRHARVKGWTKQVDIFEKDFIIIPINERSHWFLGIICFPGLTGPVRMSDNTPIQTDNKKKDASVLVGGQAPAKIWGTTISLVKPGGEPSSAVSTRSHTITLLENEEERGDESDRDEAEADDDDMEPNTTDEESVKDEDLMDEATPRTSKPKPAQEPIKQPCILIFDSLACASRSRVCATLREYLAVEWKVRNKGKSRDFSKDVFKGAVPKVPQQTNFIDCGVYVLQYVDTFFKHPITDYRMPIRSIKEWFTTEEVNRKRFEIMTLLHSLMREQNIDMERLNLPNLNLSAYPMFDGDEDEVIDDGEYEDDGLIDHEEEAIEEEEGEEEEEDEDEDDSFDDILSERLKPKPFDIRDKHRLEAINKFEISPSVRIEPQARIERIEARQSPRRFDTPSPRHERLENIRTPTEQTRPEPTPPSSRPRLPDSVTICEANSKRKLPLSLKDIRNPRQSSSSSSPSQQATIEKVKRMKVD